MLSLSTFLNHFMIFFQDIMNDWENLRNTETPTFLGTYGAVLIGLGINLALVIAFHFVAKRKIAREAQKQE